MVVFNVFPAMSSSVPATNNNNNSRKSTSSPSSSASTNSSDFTKEQWLELLRILPTTSLVNLQLAWKEFVEETAGQRNPEQKTLLPDASTLVRAVATQQNELAQNAYDKLRFDALLKQQLDVDRKALEQPNGLDALAAAALANTNSEVRQHYLFLNKSGNFLSGRWYTPTTSTLNESHVDLSTLEKAITPIVARTLCSLSNHGRYYNLLRKSVGRVGEVRPFILCVLKATGG